MEKRHAAHRYRGVRAWEAKKLRRRMKSQRRPVKKKAAWADGNRRKSAPRAAAAAGRGYLRGASVSPIAAGLSPHGTI
jgi:hypothetical protein